MKTFSLFGFEITIKAAPKIQPFLIICEDKDQSDGIVPVRGYGLNEADVKANWKHPNLPILHVISVKEIKALL